MKLSRFQLVFSAQEKIIFTQFPGSAIRGVFGKAFKAISCVTQRSECRGCIHKTQCAFAQTFKTTRLIKQRIDDVPQPLVIDTSDVPSVINLGDSFFIHITLVGDSIRFIDEIIQAWDFSGSLGLDSQGKKSSYQLLSVEEVDASMPKLISQSDTVLLDLITPHRAFRREGYNKSRRLITPDTFIVNTYLANIVRRYVSLHSLYDKPLSKQDSQALISVSHAIEPMNQSLTLTKQYRISQTQNKKLDFSGLIGKITIKGDYLPALLPVLWAGQWLHVGNSPMYGLGRYRITGVSHV